jgi:manganese oxidase
MTSLQLHNFGGLLLNRVQSSSKFPYKFFLVLCVVVATFLAGCNPQEKSNHKPVKGQLSYATPTLCDQKNEQGKSNTITAEVVALEQIITFNRFGAFNPAGMVYALRKDVVYDDPTTKDKEEALPLPEASKLDDPEFAKSIAGRVSLKSDKRPRPLVLRVNEGECLQVKFWNLLSPLPKVHTRFDRADFPQGGVQRHAMQETPVDNPKNPNEPKARDISTPPRCFDEKGNKNNNTANCNNLFPFPRQEEPDYPITRAASIHVNGLDYVPVKPEICGLDEDELASRGYTKAEIPIIESSCADGKHSLMGSDGSNVGKNASSLVEPGNHTTYVWYARQEGGYFFYSAGALAGGEGDGGQLGLGLFGSVNVEPKDSIWYRSQVTHDVLTSAKTSSSVLYDDLNYEKLTILDGNNQIVNSDLNAIIYQPKTKDNDGNLTESGMDCAKQSPGSSCGMSFREFTTIFHDENNVFQAFAELADEDNPLSDLADGMAINYGSSGVGSVVLANMKKLGPGKDCPECKLEEFFLSSWVNGDPAMIVRRDEKGEAVQALYPDDPSNVHHSYLGDPVRFRNIHAGPKETHVFHLHTHQWLQDKNDPNANYLDSQTISPGSSYTYDIQYGGGGNRNLTVGDAIFHCHLYPHFAAGMWELWRNHDVFEDGLYVKKDDPKSNPLNLPAYRYRNLPDHELEDDGAPNPALVPIPGFPLAPLPTAEVRGYPFFMAGVPGHRPPQPPMDMALKNPDNPSAGWLDGGLPRHVIMGGSSHVLDPDNDDDLKEMLYGKGAKEAIRAAQYIARRTWQLNQDDDNLALAKKLDSATLKILPQCGTKSEVLAMAFHAGWSRETITGLKKGEQPDGMLRNVWEACRGDFKQALADLPDTFQWDLNAQDTQWPVNRMIHSDPKKPDSLAPMNPLWEGKGYVTVNAAYPKGHTASTAYSPGNKFRINGFAPAQGAPFAEPCPTGYYEDATKNGKEDTVVPVNRLNPRVYKTAYIQFDLTVNKYGWHDPQARMPVLEEDAAATLSGDRLAEPLFFRANSGDCIQFQATNLIPSVLNLDDFQVYSPTDTIGQHIHLVKFDVTSSDGSANGWNYEDGTFSPDEVRERIEASSKSKGGNAKKLNGEDIELNPTPYILPHGTNSTNALGECNDDAEENNKNHPWCGAQATVQRWWADPVLNDQWQDRTMRAVFTHDHYGPSSHQQHGFYGALVVEPKDSVWTSLNASMAQSGDKVKNFKKSLASANEKNPEVDCMLSDGASSSSNKSILEIKQVYGGTFTKSTGKKVESSEERKRIPLKCKGRNDGGPTSYAANIMYPNNEEKSAEDKKNIHREYNLAFADFAILYNADLRPVNPPSQQDELGLPYVVRTGLKPDPGGISTTDPGTQLLNYRNEPIPMRIAEEDDHSEDEINKPSSLEYHQKTTLGNGKGDVKSEGDMANVFSSISHSTSCGNLKSVCIDPGKVKVENNNLSETEQWNISAEDHAAKRLDKLSNNVPHEIVDPVDLKNILIKTEQGRRKFVQHIYGEEPWRDLKGGDPSTPVLAAYIGEPLKLHLIQGAQEEQHVFSMTGMKWLAEPESKNSGYMNGQQIGISEHFEFDVPVPSGGTDVTDYWYGSPAVENMWDGMWGLVRTFGFALDASRLEHKFPSLQRLPGVESPPLVSAGLTTCPPNSMLPESHRPEFFIGAWLASDLLSNEKTKRGLSYNERFGIADPNAIVFIEQDLAWLNLSPDKVLLKLRERYSSGKKIEPLILRAHAGDCVTLKFTNYLPENMAQLDGPQAPVSWSYNLMPPIVDGFNFNQAQTSSRVDLQPQLVSFSQRTESSAAIGVNNCKTVKVDKEKIDMQCENPSGGSLITSPKACRKAGSTTNSPEFSGCELTTLKWYAGDIKITKDRQLEPQGVDTSELEKTLSGSNNDSISEEVFRQASAFDVPMKNNGSIIGWKRYTPIEFGAVAIRDFGDLIKRSSHGGIGALIVEPKDATWEKTPLETASAEVKMPKDTDSFREFVLLMQDDLSLQQHNQPMPNHRMADDAEDTGQKGFNYHTEPLWARNGVGTSGADLNELNGVDYSNTLSSYRNIAPCSGMSCDPETPIFHAKPGEKVRFRIMHPGGHSRQHTFVLHGHNWDYQPWRFNSTQLFDGKADDKLLTARVGAIGGIGPGRHLNILVNAGGEFKVPGDYLFRVQEQFQFQGGIWGLLRVKEDVQHVKHNQ